ncbi:DUF1990 family protein [Paractinoplanes rishiriensis]|uniref:DUF1990 domain-containing protein n=1 Tax=Paractinoplanes rishiriensis TaxID=1050105 RepID=A0A919MYJ0_9ACTN|nr:DUF1990 domain-containing protein [Actinoplanes rishiriensis]GIE99969.1 hypothetical protein Ari01nite_74340 [Actinoplanes rishiriensis]
MPGFSYDVVGETRPAQDGWLGRPAGYRRFERTVCVGRGTDRWEAVAASVLSWQVKIRSGFVVRPVDGEVLARSGARYELTVRVGPLTVREPVRVVEVVTGAERCGFSYGTLEGHPVSGEEAFVAHRSADGRVWLTIRSLTRPADSGWRWLFPVLLIAQRFYRGRYLRALPPG